MSMKVLSREDILGINDSKLEPFDVPAWGGTVYIRSLTASQRDAYEKSNVVKRKGKNDINWADYRARFLALVICNKEGVRMFSDADAPALGEKNASITEPIFEFARQLSGITKKDVEEMEDQENDVSAVTVPANGNGH